MTPGPPTRPPPMRPRPAIQPSPIHLNKAADSFIPFIFFIPLKEYYMLTALTIFVLVAGFILWKLAIIVPMRQACVLERFGNFRRGLEPGFHVVVPFLDKVAYLHGIGDTVLDCQAKRCTI